MTQQLRPANNAHIFRWIKLPPQAQDLVLPQNNGIVLPICKLDFLSADECQQIIRLASSVTAKKALTGTGDGRSQYKGRISVVNTLYPSGKTRWVFDRIENLVAGIGQHFRFQLAGFFEGAQVYRYPTGGYLNEHMDIGKGVMSTRKLAVTIQLVSGDDYQGGDLYFPDSDAPAARQQGSITVFPTYMRHGVREVTQGTRISLVTWIHGPPFQ